MARNHDKVWKGNRAGGICKRFEYMENSKDKSMKQIKYGSMISYVLIFINILLGLLYTPWILKEIGDSHYGLYTLTSSLIALFLMDFGMSSAVSRFVAMYRVKNQQDMVDCFIGMAFKLYFCIMAMIGVVLSVVYFNLDKIYSNLTSEELRVFKIVFAITAVCVIACFPVNICNGILNAYEEYIVLKISDIFNKLGTVIVTMIVLLLHGGVYGLVFVNGFFNVITFIVKFQLIYRRTPARIKFKCSDLSVFRGSLSFQGWTTVASLAQQMIFNLMPTVLAMVADTFAITLFGFANTIEGYVYTITNAINGMFLPKVMRIVVKDENAGDALPLMIKVGRINQSVVSLLLIGIFSVGRQFVDLWVGNEYQELYICILLICIPYSVSASQQIANTSLTALNKVKYPAIIYMVTGGGNLLLSYVLAGKFGIIGVSFTIGLTFWLRVILLNIVYVRLLHINIFYFFKECHIKMMPALLLCLSASYTIGKYLTIPFGGWNGFGIKVVLICIIYCICMWVIGWNHFEKQLIKSLFHRNKYNVKG